MVGTGPACCAAASTEANAARQQAMLQNAALTIVDLKCALLAEL